MGVRRSGAVKCVFLSGGIFSSVLSWGFEGIHKSFFFHLIGRKERDFVGCNVR